jgi:hypothetical protein
MKYPRTNNAYHKSRRDNSDRIDALLAECEKMEDELAAQGKLEGELASVTEQRDRLAVICGELIAAVRINSMRDTFREATPDQIEEWLKQWVDKLAAVKGGSHD